MLSVDTVAYEVLTQGGTGLASLVGSRVYFAVLPADFQNDAAALVFRPESGSSKLWGVPSHARSYLFECYGGDAAGGNWAGAEAVYRALHDVWVDAGLTAVDNGSLLQGWEEQAGVPLVHPDTRHKYYVCRFGGRIRSN